MARWWWVFPAAALVALLLRRGWATAAVLALLVAGTVGWLHAVSLPAAGLDEGQTRWLTVRLTSPARHYDGQSGPWWSAHAAVVAGAGDARVGLSGRGSPDYQIGDKVTAAMLVATPDTPGESARLRIRGSPTVEPADTWPARVRVTMRAVAGDGDAGWLLSGMTIGLDEGLSAVAAEQMQAAGLTHLTAVSGANCAVLVLLVLWICGWLHLGRFVRAVVASLVVAGFVVVVGPQPSILRAATMTLLALAAGLLGGRRAGAHVLQVSALVLLLIDPWLAYSVGFMLSIAATAGLIALVERGPLAATVAAQVATFPILLAIGASVGVKSVVTNVLVTPFAVVVPVIGLTSLAAQALVGLGAPVAAVGRLLTGRILWLASLPIPNGVTWVAGTAGVVLAAFVTAVAFTVGRHRIVLVTAALVAVVSLTVRASDGWPPPDWWIVACDVGQGDGLVVRSSAGIMVVDTGPEPAAMDGCLSRLGVHTVDLLLMTHFHADHVAGLAGVLRGRTVGQVWLSPCDEPAEERLQAQALLGTLPATVPATGSVFQFGDAQLQVVSVQRVVRAGSVPNNSSVAFRLVAPQGTAVFLGDMEAEAQGMSMRSADLAADIVKVPHHGSANFDPGLPAVVRPRIALVSVGADNTYGHPSPEALASWQAVGAQVFTTMDNGDVAVTRGLQTAVRGVIPPTTR